MTRTEVEQLTDRELDMRVAEAVFGHEVGWQGFTLAIFGVTQKAGYPIIMETGELIPHYSTDWNDMRDVLEHLDMGDLRIRWQWTTKEWRCMLLVSGIRRFKTVYADTLPRAVAIAAILACEEATP